MSHDAPNRSDSASTPAGFTLWMERGFSRREMAPRMLAAAPSLRLVSTPEQPVLGSPTVAYPPLDTAEGIDALNELVARHGIDAIWPQRSAVHDLSGVACEVHTAGTPEVVALADDKGKFSDWLGADDVFRADATEVVGAAGVAEEYAKRSAEGRDVCVKPAVGVFGNGYWHLSERPEASLLNQIGAFREIHPRIYLAAMELEEEQTGPQRLLVMDYLPGPEVSIDLLCWRGTPLVHAARTKLDNSTQRIQSEHPVVEHSRSVATRLAMHGIISMQYRLDREGDWRMLEVNPRPAGGCTKTEDAGFGLIANWAQLVAHQTGPDDITQYEGDVTLTFERVATPVHN